ncbi:hypothetical protein TWF694_008758 [Orbilia ellipsospora]|uniref:Uncharacterized protein n=1 Tax=Orbilia ellipsospora TaxID=2528407 RepID=A0AAV9XDF0_9PEZI
MSRIPNLLLHLLLGFIFFTVLSAAADPLSYCKCTCGTASIIIPLDHDDPKALTCLDCNRSFCRSSNINICDGKKEDEISTSCFQRDSVKDETVVLIFIVATGGLLIYAALKPLISRWFDPQTQAYEQLPTR